jgi:hypothetical protein
MDEVTTSEVNMEVSMHMLLSAAGVLCTAGAGPIRGAAAGQLG